jgi:DNA-binding ferritin-like protein
MSTNEALRQQRGTVEDNAVGIDREKAEHVVEALNVDLASAYVLYHQLRKHHWNVEGAEHRDVHDFLGAAAEDAELAADEIAERVQALGGVPVSGMADLAEHAPVESEGPDVYDVRTSLEHDLDLSGDVIETLREHIGLAEDLGDYATSELLRDHLETLEDRAHELDHYLEDDTLVLESSAN